MILPDGNISPKGGRCYATENPRTSKTKNIL